MGSESLADVFAGTQSLDTVPPSVSNEAPAPGELDVLVGTAVTFDLTDDPGGSGVDLTSILVTIEGVNAIVAGVVQAGFSGSLTPITDGYAISVAPDAGLPQNTAVDVTVDAQDLADPANVMTQVAYSFNTEIGDNQAPQVINQIPADLQTGVQYDTAIEFDLIDLIGTGTFTTGVDIAHITVTVDGNAVITNGAFEPGYSGAITAIDSGGYRVRVDGGELPCGVSIPITVDARDQANPANTMTTVNYSFTTETGDNTAPVVSNRHPPPSAIQVPLTQAITFDIKDTIGPGSRVNKVQILSVVVRIDGVEAIIGGVVQAGYTGTVTAIDDGYEVSIVPNAGWSTNQAVTVEVDAYDGPLLFIESFDVGWEDLPPDPQFSPPDDQFGPEFFETSWEDSPNPNPAFSPPDLSFTEEFDASWDDVP